VVDNAPGDQDCEALVAAHGARYVREDRQGLDVARAAGARAARGDVVAFTDDDVIVPARWLANVARLFADARLGLLVGPVYPAELRTVWQYRHERFAPLSRGMNLRV